MNINSISHSISPNFKGLLRLDSGIMVNGPGFPHGYDQVDVFTYFPFSDDCENDIENDKLKMKQLSCYLESEKQESDKYSLKQIGADIYLGTKDSTNDPKACKVVVVDCSKSKFNPRVLEPEIQKRLINLSEVSADEIISKVMEIKNRHTKSQPSLDANGSILFKYM